MKKITSLLTAIILAISAYANVTTSQGTNATPMFKFTILGGDSVSIEKYSWSSCSGDLVIPETTEIDGVTYRVTAVKSLGFYICNNITSVTIPNSISLIGRSAFDGCSKLQQISLGNGVKEIQNTAFSNCELLSSIHIPASVDTIGYGIVERDSSLVTITVDAMNKKYHSSNNCLIETATRKLIAGCKTSSIPNDGSVTILERESFCGLTMTEILVPDSIQEIKDQTFSYCTNLTSLHIPAKVKKLGDYITLQSQNIISLTVDSNNPIYHSADSCIIETATKELLLGCKTSVIPADGSVTKLGTAFRDVTGLTSITLPPAITNIGFLSFSGCTGLQEIKSLALFPPTVSSTTYSFQDVNKRIPVYISAFSKKLYPTTSGWSDFTNFVALGENEINGISYNIIAKDEVEVTFKGDTHKSYENEYTGDFVIPDSVYIEGTPFAVTKIGDYAFAGCSGLMSITFPKGLTSIGNYAFLSCNNLKQLHIPANVTSLGCGLVTGCSTLNSLTCAEENSHYKSVDNCIIQKSQKELIAGINNSVIPADGSVKSIGISAFEKCNKLDTITIPEGVKTIGKRAFYDCDDLDTVIISNSVTTIDENAFRDCGYLKKIVLGSGLQTIGDSAFYNCKKVAEIWSYAAYPPTITDYTFYNVPYSTTLYVHRKSVDYYKEASYWRWDFSYIYAFPAFEVNGIYYNILDTDSVEVSYQGKTYSTFEDEYVGEVVIPDTIRYNDVLYRVTTIGQNAFRYCKKLTAITIPESITSVGTKAFDDCSGLVTVNWNAKRCENAPEFTESKTTITNFNIGEKVVSIPTGLCKDMTEIASIKIPNSVTELGASAFEGCTKLRTLHIGNGLTSFPAKAFAGCTGLINLTIRAEMPPYVEANTFNNVSKTLLVHVPCTSLGYYKAAYYWNEFTNYEESFLLDFLVKPADPEQGSTLIIQHPTCQNITTIFKAIPNNGYIFKGWNDGNTDNPRTEYISEDIEYIATFAPVSSAIENIVVENISNVNKVLENGTIYILRNGEKYTIDGRKVE